MLFTCTRVSDLPGHLAGSPDPGQMAEVQPSSCALGTWARNSNHRDTTTQTGPSYWLCLTELLLLSHDTRHPVDPLTSSYSMNKFYSGLNLSTRLQLVFCSKLAFNWPCCSLTLQKICTDKYNISPPPSRWNCDKEQKNLLAVTAPSGPETQKSQVLYLFTERLINILNILTGGLWDDTEILPHLFSISLLMCMYLCNSGFICCAYPCAISCLHVVSLCFILLIENSLWANAWRNESWMMCAFALVNLPQSLA